jgi:transcriptional/translational regulatory protein YebC/TACO1
MFWLRMWRRDATSAILLYMPEMCSTDNKAALLVCSRTAQAQSIRAAVQNTLGELTEVGSVSALYDSNEVIDVDFD